MTCNKYINQHTVKPNNLEKNENISTESIKSYLESTHPRKPHGHHIHFRQLNYGLQNQFKNIFKQNLKHPNCLSQEFKKGTNGCDSSSSVLLKQDHTKRIRKPLCRRLSMHFKRDLFHLININENRNNTISSYSSEVSEDKIKMILNECQFLTHMNSKNLKN